MNRGEIRNVACNGFNAISVGLILMAHSWAQYAQGQEGGISAETKAGVIATTESLVKAFNRHDAKQLASLWKADAVHVSRSDGKKIEGRKAIEEGYAKLFSNDPQATLSIDVQSLRGIMPGIVTVDCSCSVKHTDGEVSESQFDALLVLDGGRWIIAQVYETEVPETLTAADALSDLEWLIGNWSDTSDEIQVFNEVKWAHGGNFLIRKYRQQQKEETIREGTQVIGWDAEHQRVRSWLFDSDGSFGEGEWQPSNEKKWICKQVVKLPDGRRASFSQIIEQLSPDRISLQTVGIELEGQALPGSGAKVLVRKSEPTSERK